MKKLKLKLQNIEETGILTREQLKMVMGGSGASGTCGTMVTNKTTGQRYVNGYGVSRSDAMSTAGSSSGQTFMDQDSGDVYEYDGHYCCDSCSNFPQYSEA